MSDTEPTELNGEHDARGRFTLGNKAARGNPMNRRAQEIRVVLLEKMTPEVAGRIADRLIAMAEGGDLPAIRELLDRCIGKPIASDIAERLDNIETALAEKANNEREH
jgi:hypothetical protein